MSLDFEWDDGKAAENLRNHGVSFAQAALAFRDRFGVEWIDFWEAYDEERIDAGRDRQSNSSRCVYRAGGADQNHFGPTGEQR
jgi:uncharacterized DUF497 family protein